MFREYSTVEEPEYAFKFHIFTLNITFSIYYLILILIGFTVGYRFTDETFYYNTRMEVYHPFQDRTSKLVVFPTLACKYINAATICMVSEIAQQLGFSWFFASLFLPGSFVVGSIIISIMKNIYKISSFEEILIKTSGPFAIIFYFIITIANVFFIAASFSAVVTFILGYQLMEGTSTLISVAIISLTYVLIGGFNLISLLDIISLTFFTFLLLITTLMVVISEADSSNLVQTIIPSTHLHFKTLYTDTICMILFGGFIDPIHVNALIFSYKSFGEKFYFFIFPATIILCFIIQGMSGITVVWSGYTPPDFNKTTDTYSLSLLYSIRLSSPYIKLFLFNAITACLICFHNTMLIHVSYQLCSSMPRMLRNMPYRSRICRQIMHQFAALIFTILAIIICLYSSLKIFCIYTIGLDLIYTFVFPQILSAMITQSCNAIGALFSLLISLLLRCVLLDFNFCNLHFYVLNNIVEEGYKDKSLISTLFVKYIPTRTVIVMISICLNLMVSYMSSKTDMLVSLYRVLEDYIVIDFFGIDDEATVDESTASIKLKWNLVRMENENFTTPFDLRKIPDLYRYYENIPEDLKQQSQTIVKRPKVSHGVANKLVLMFKTPLQNRLFKKDMLCDERRRYAHLTKLYREWNYYLKAIKEHSNHRLSSMRISKEMVDFVAYRFQNSKEHKDESTQIDIDDIINNKLEFNMGLSTVIEYQMTSSDSLFPSNLKSYSTDDDDKTSVLTYSKVVSSS